jgi:hypothetical protein
MDRNGELENHDILHFAGRAASTALDGPYLILFHTDFVEIRDVRTRELRQVIAGQNIRCLDDVQGGIEKRNVMMAMAHPELGGRELVLELVLEEAMVTMESSRIEIPDRSQTASGQLPVELQDWGWTPTRSSSRLVRSNAQRF